jgi:polyphosphate kinase
MNVPPSKKPITLHRDLSWLAFNYRVLQEAKDDNVPLLERIKFLGIYSSNLDEFFRVRIASLKKLTRVSLKTQRQMEFDPILALNDISEMVKKQQIEFSEIYFKQLLPALYKEGIKVLRLQELSRAQHQELDTYVEEVLIQYIQPILMVKNKIRTFLRNNNLYLVVILETAGQSLRYALVRIPTDNLPRFIELQTEEKLVKTIILLDDIVRHALPSLFHGYRVRDSFSVKMTRDAELHIDDEYAGNLVDKIKRSIAKRNIGSSTRFVYDRKMPENCKSFLTDNFSLDQADMHPEGRYHNNFDFFKFPSFGKTYLKDKYLPPLAHPQLSQSKDFFKTISAQEQLLHYPYQRYDYVLQFLEAAAIDPQVKSIKITQYRVAKDSQVILALRRALAMGKEVVVFMEVKARFDEEANISWAEKLETWGATVLYSIPKIKVHAKLALVTRREGTSTKAYAYLSTGNFNENTATVYTDFGFFTADERICKDVQSIFAFLQSNKKTESQPKGKHLLIGKFLPAKVQKMIDNEIANAQAGKEARVFIKVNSLQDQRMIQKLYTASQSGVKIQIIIRGICCLLPKIKGLSDNIEAISVVDRFLEHSRIYCFHNGGDTQVYLSSADLMTRNLYHRIEAAFPIYNPTLKAEILYFLNLQWNDNVKARILDANFSNQYKPRTKKDVEHRSQTELYDYYKSKLK